MTNLVPMQMTSIAGRPKWRVWDIKYGKPSSLSFFSEYDSEEECKSAIEYYSNIIRK